MIYLAIRSRSIVQSLLGSLHRFRLFCACHRYYTSQTTCSFFTVATCEDDFSYQALYQALFVAPPIMPFAQEIGSPSWTLFFGGAEDLWECRSHDFYKSPTKVTHFTIPKQANLDLFVCLLHVSVLDQIDCRICLKTNAATWLCLKIPPNPDGLSIIPRTWIYISKLQ